MNNEIKLKKEEWTVRRFIDELQTINLQPQYQREFVYKPDEQAKVIDSILLDIPLNVIYFNENEIGSDNNFKYEVIDGQQRLTSIRNFVNHSLPLANMTNKNWDNKVWQGLAKELKNKILSYKMDIYVVTKSNASSIKYDLFKRINTVGEKLNSIELLNATYPGTFVNELKKFCYDNDAKLKAITGKGFIRGDTEEIIINWFADDVLRFLARHQKHSILNLDNEIGDAKNIASTSVKVFNWIETLVDKKYRTKLYRNRDCYKFYKKFHSLTFNNDELMEKCENLYTNDEVQDKKGILEYCLQDINGYHANEQLLNLRTFPPEWKPTIAKEQNFKCAKCNKDLKDENEYKKAELDHVTSWKNRGLTEKSNCQLLCQRCNRTKSKN